MSSSISTREELSSNARRVAGKIWRVIEPQHRIATVKLTDTLEEQNLLEEVIERTKPAIPPECRHLDFLLFTPFRYDAPYPKGSRFRKAGRTLGVFYASENPDTAIAETCFHQLLFYAESPETIWPANAREFTAFAVEYATPFGIDLTRTPFDDRTAIWEHPTNYEKCQEVAEHSRSANVEYIKYSSVRDPQQKANIAIMNCAAFTKSEPVDRQTWGVLVGPTGARALCDMPRLSIDFGKDLFAADPRIKIMNWDR
jgi:hypothetical protein